MKLHTAGALVALTLFSGSAFAQASSASDVAMRKLATAVQRLSDEDALRSLAYHYGRGNDEIAIHFGDRAKGKALGAAEYAQAFASDIQVEVYATGGATPIGKISGIPAWVDFVDGYYAGNKYSSTLHLMSNFSTRFTGTDAATVSAYALAPHFLQAAAKDRAAAEPTVEFMLCRYDYDAKRLPDGSWRMTKLTIRLEEIQRNIGFYPGGQRKG